MTSHYPRYANVAANLQPATSEEDLVGALTSQYPIAIQRFLIGGNIKTTKDTIYLLGKLEGLEAQDKYWKPRQYSDRQDANRRPPYNSHGNRTDTTRRDSVQVQ